MSNERSTLMIEDMSGGIDRREGVVNRDTRKFYDLLNFNITIGKRLRRRYPANQIDGLIDVVSTQGAVFLNGSIYTFAPRGTVVNHTCLDPHPSGTPHITGTSAYLNTLYFDRPPYDTGWTFVDAVSLNGVIVALIGHRIGYPAPESTVTRYMVHVFDQTETTRTGPTYLLDGAAPICFPQEPYGASVDPSAGYYAPLGGYRPVMSVDGGRIYISLWDGNVAYCAINRPRVWNVRTAEEIQQDGRWYFLSHEYRIAGSDTTVYTIPINGLAELQQFAEYGVEGVVNGQWVAFGESAIFPSVGKYFRVADAPGAYPNASGVTVTLYVSGVTYPTNIRFVARAKPSVIVTSGCRIQPDGSVSAGTVSFQGASVPVPATQLSIVDPGARPGSGFGLAYYAYYPKTGVFTASTTKPYGQCAIIAASDYVRPTGVATLGPGTMIATGTAIVGTGTTFLTTFAVGRYIYSDNFKCARRITVITDNLNMTIDSAFTDLTSGVVTNQYYIVSNPLFTLPGTYSTVNGSPVLQCNGATLPVQALLNTTVTAGSETRRVIAAGKGSITCDSAFTVTATGLTCAYAPTWVPDYAVGDAGTTFYATKEAEAITLSGDGDAGFINSSLCTQDGSNVVAMATVQNRIYVQYSTCMLMWGVSTTFVPTYLAKQAIGASGTATHGVSVDDGVIMFTQFGPRLFYPDGNSKDYIKYRPFGDSLEGITLPNFKNAVWWQSQNIYVAVGDNADIWVLTYNQPAKIVGWSRWNIAGITSLDDVYVTGTQLMLRVGGVLYLINPAATSFRDSGDAVGAGNAYQSKARWLYADFGKPRNNKKLVRLELVQKGAAQVSFFVNADDDTDATSGPPVVEGNTQGHAKVAIQVYGSAIAPQVVSTDETGYELDCLGVDYLTHRR